jgi:TRAP-type C4-dicarboxylate transport system permease small subunit
MARYVNFDIVFADELGKYLFIWLCLIGISAAARDNQHIRLTYIAARLPVNQRLVDLTSQVLFLVFALLFLYWSARLTWMHLQMDKSVMGFRFPMFWFTLALPFGFGLTSLRLVQDIINKIKQNGPERPNGPDGFPAREEA